jgi:transposase
VQDTKLFETILGIQAPWRIARVALDTSGGRVDLWAEHADDTRWRCPDCDRELACRITRTSASGGTSTASSAS